MLIFGASGGMAISATLNSDSIQEFADQGNWGTVAGTAIGGFTGSVCGYRNGRGMDNLSMPTDKGRLNHIFSNEQGHVPYTAQNQKLLTGISNPKNYVGTDQYGNYWYSKTLPDGSQAWSEVRNGIIWDAGINSIPRQWNPQTGFKKGGIILCMPII